MPRQQGMPILESFDAATWSLQLACYAEELLAKGRDNC